MHIAFVTSEAFPYAKTGGLADVAGSLPRAFNRIGLKCSIFLPCYPGIKAEPLNLRIEMKLGPKIEPADIYHIPGEVEVFLVKNDHFYNRPGLYGSEKGDYPDNLERFSFFSRTTLETIKRLKLKYNILHLHDWQTALIPIYLKCNTDQIRNNIKTVFTIHNLGYQGIFTKDKFPLLEIPQEYFTIEGIEYYDQINFLKGGLIFSDFLTTVSPTYAREIQNDEFGFGLNGILSKRKEFLKGILNGIDTKIWNPKNDQFIYYNYLNPIDKKINKLHLQRELKLDVSDEPLIGIVSRLAEQKGIDLICNGLDQIINSGFKVILLGTGDERYHRILEEKLAQYPDRLSINLKFDEILAHRIYAGADFFLMPSRYEPCGLGQMIALTYGTIPVVRKTGGLADSVFEFEPAKGKGNGFLFEIYNVDAMIQTLLKAREVYNNKNHWNQLVLNAMSCDFSWDRTAREYLSLYEKILTDSLAAS